MSQDIRSLREEIAAYLGTEKTKILDNFKPEDWKKFQELQLSTKKSYFVKGTPKRLKKFEAYFLFLCAYKKPLYKRYLIEEYKDILTAPANNSDDLDDVGVDRELIFLYMHNVEMGVGNTTGWVTITILNKIANRNRHGNPTVVLSERDFPAFQSTEELEVIDLGGASISAQASAIAENIKKSKEQKDRDTNGSNETTSTRTKHPDVKPRF